MNQDEIRVRLRRLIDSEELPCEDGCDVWAGHGTAKRCAACGSWISSAEVEFEVELPQSKRVLFLHEPCHRLWVEECRDSGKI